MDATQGIESAYTQIIVPRMPELLALCQRLRVRRLDLFGSAVNERFDPAHSDLDFLVDFEPMPPGPHARSCRDLHAGLEALFGRTVDLLTEGALVNPYLQWQIDSEKRQLFPAP